MSGDVGNRATTTKAKARLYANCQMVKEVCQSKKPPLIYFCNPQNKVLWMTFSELSFVPWLKYATDVYRRPVDSDQESLLAISQLRPVLIDIGDYNCLSPQHWQERLLADLVVIETMLQEGYLSEMLFIFGDLDRKPVVIYGREAMISFLLDQVPNDVDPNADIDSFAYQMRSKVVTDQGAFASE